MAACVAAALALPVAAVADVVVADDQIVTGRLCAGVDCINDEDFGSDLLRLKENNLRLVFTDTTPGATDWQVVANESADGGLAFFGVHDQTTDRYGLRVRAGVFDDTLVLDPAGRPRLTQGIVTQPAGAATSGRAPVDGPALLAALRELPVFTYQLAGESGEVRRIGPRSAAFGTAFGLASGSQLSTMDVAGVALAAVKELDPLVAGATAGAPGPQGATGPAGPKGVQGDPGPPGARPADFDPPASQLEAFKDRLDALRIAQDGASRKHRSLARAVKKGRRAAKRLG